MHENPRPPAATYLEEWLATNGLSRFQFCARTEINPGLLWNWCSGRSRPSLPHAARIEQVTGIPPRAWLIPESCDNPDPQASP